MALVLSLFAVFAGGFLIVAPVSASSGDGPIQVCHGTSSDGNPYEVNNPNMSSIKDETGQIDPNGHGTHTGPVWILGLKDAHTAWGDIIPEFEYTTSTGGTVSYPGLNWDAWGQEIWANGCTPPAPVKTITLECVSTPSTPQLTVDLRNYSATPTVAITDNGNPVAGDSWDADKDYYLQTTLSPNDVSHHVVVTLGGTEIFNQTDEACFVAAPAIDIQKTPDTQSVISGGTVTFTIDVTNTGNVPLTGVAVTDALAPDCDETIGALAAGASITEYTCTVSNVTEGFTNTAGVTGYYGTTPVTDSDTAAVTVTAPAPAIEITKTPDSQSVLTGSPVTFTIDVTNTGNVPLTGVAVTDALAPDCDATIGALAAGASIDAYTCTVANVTAGFTNTADVSGWYGQTEVTDDDTADVAVNAPGIDIQKTPDTQSVLTGTSATFTITVTNTGNTALTNVVVTDPSAPQCASSGALAVGEQASYQCTVANVTEGFTNTAYVSGWFEQVEVTDNDGAAVTVNAPAIAVEKAPNLQTIASGATATFTITVTNTGTVTLHDISVADPLTPGCVRADLGSLAPGESTVAYTCTTAGLTAGFTNVASATGHYGEGGSITASDDAVVSVTPPPPPPSDTYGASATMCSPTGVITTYTATGFTQTGANDALAAQIAGLSAPVNGACGPTETVVTPLPATVEEVTQPVEVTPLPATVPMPAKVIPPKAAQAGDGATAPVPPAAGWILLLAGSLGVLVTARKLIQVRG